MDDRVPFGLARPGRERMSLAKDKSAVIFSGGGAYASYGVGVLKALVNGHSPASQYQPVSIDVCTGTSAGAINAAILVSSGPDAQGVELLESMWRGVSSGDGRCGNSIYRIRGDFLQLLDPDCYRRNVFETFAELTGDSAYLLRDFLQRGGEFVGSRKALSQRLLELVDFASFFSTEGVHRVLARAVSPERIRASATSLRIVSTNWNTGKARLFANEDFTDDLGVSPVLASAAIPGIFQFHRIDGVPYADGTVVENTPLKPSIEVGASSIHLIEPPDPARFPPESLPSAIETMYRTIVIMLSVVMQRDIDYADEINQGLSLLRRLASGERIGGADIALASRALVRSLAHSDDAPPYRPLTIHRYIPTHQFGGLTGLLDFRRKSIDDMIEAGYRSAVEHDCAAAGCVIPDEADLHYYAQDRTLDLEGQLR